MQCPQCESARTWKDGIRSTKNGNVQRYLCRDCSFRFSFPQMQDKINVIPKSLKRLEPGTDLAHSRICDVDFSLKERLNRSSFPVCEDVASHEITGVGKALNVFPSYNSNRRVCVTEAEDTKNLAETESQQNRAAGATKKLTEAHAKGKFLEFAWWMKKEGYKESTIIGYNQLLQRLVNQGAILYQPETVKETIAKQNNWCEGRKLNAVKAYTKFLKWQGGNWDPPKYRPEEKLPFIPLEQEIDALISGCSLRISCFLQLMKETAFRPGEAWRLEWTDVDCVSRAVTLNHPEKRSKPRQVRISRKFRTMLSNLHRSQIPLSERIFNYASPASLRRVYERQRKRIAFKLGNPRILKITFKTFRHWKATMEYNKTKDILHVMLVLGHKNIKNTLRYTQLVNLEEDEYVCKVATTARQASQLIEVGYEYVCEMENVKLFRKRK